jgi:hypothetical protein
LRVLVPASAAAAAVSGQSMLATGFVVSVANVAVAVARLVALEVVELTGASLRQGTVVTIPRVKAIVNVAIKAGAAVKPWTGTNEHPAEKPVGAIVAIRCAVERDVIKVAVGANGSHSDADGNLRRPQGCTTEQRSGEN